MTKNSRFTTGKRCFALQETRKQIIHAHRNTHTQFLSLSKSTHTQKSIYY